MTESCRNTHCITACCVQACIGADHSDHLQWACKHQNWTMEQWRKMDCSDDSRGDGRVHVHCLTAQREEGECDALGNVLMRNLGF